jgi:hypothetical protein
VPGVLRRIMKKAKLYEVIEVRTTKVDKLIDHFDDEIFSNEVLGNFKKEVVIVFALVYFE